MNTPAGNIERFVSLLDGIVTTGPLFPPVAIAVTSGNESEIAREFLKEYARRFSGDDKNSLVPHVFAEPAPPLNASAGNRMPDVALLDHISNELKNTIPKSAGPRPGFPFFTLCHDVITANNIWGSGEEDARRKLCDHLYDKWENRTPGLVLIRSMPGGEVLGNALNSISKALFRGLHRRWFERRLNRRKLHWFGEHVAEVTNTKGDFIARALKIVPGGEEVKYDKAALRRRILLDALLRDLDRLTKRRRFLPNHRRRRWTPVLLLDCTADRPATDENICLGVARSLGELYERKLEANELTSPLLVIAAISSTEKLNPDVGEPISAEKAAERLDRYVKHNAPPDSAWLPVLLTSELWPSKDGKVNPRIPGKLSAWAPVAIVTVIVLSAATIVTYEQVFASCANTWYNDSGERVGLSDGTCDFTPVATNPTGFPDLQQMEREIVENNAAVDKIKKAPEYRYIVFFAPLTRPYNDAGITQPANALWQLRGAIDAQKELNEKARGDTEKVPIKILLANSGDLFANGKEVASIIASQRQRGPHSIAAAIGISQSRFVTLEAFKNMPDIPVVGATITGNRMTEQKTNFFVVAPPNSAFVEKMTQWVRDNKDKKKLTGWTVIYDPGDPLFSLDLRNSLEVSLPQELLPRRKEKAFSEEDSNNTGTSDLVRELCEDALRGILPVFTGRPDQLAKILAVGKDVTECKNNKITMLAGAGAIVAMASGRVDGNSWLNLAYPVLASTAVCSEKATGYDALLVVSEAINKSHRYSGGEPSAKGVLNDLLDGFELNGRTGNLSVGNKEFVDRKSDRILILETSSGFAAGSLRDASIPSVPPSC